MCACAWTRSFIPLVLLRLPRARARARARILTCALDGGQSPFGSFMLVQGLETLSLRGRAHSNNANALAQVHCVLLACR